MKKIVFFLVFVIINSIAGYTQVAINTDGSSPDASAMLDVKSNSKGFLLPRMTSFSRITISSPVTGLIVYDTDFDALYIYDGTSWDVLSKGQVWKKNSNATFLNNAKNVGIGTYSPMGKLHVHDATHNTTLYITPGSTISGDSATILFGEDHNATYGMYWMYDGNGNEMELWGKSGSTFYGPHLTVKRNSGDVAIGDSFANGYRLSVDGKIVCEGVLVEDNGSWPDYVFDDSYNLMGLDELEQSICENNHLPGLPSAIEVEEDGFELAGMQKLVLQKVEELTLYTIEQGKMINLLKEEVKSLKDENAKLNKEIRRK